MLPDAFKQTLLNAKSIAYSDPAHGGASGVYFAKLLERMGIADQMKAKTKHPPPSGNAAHLVVAGEVELAIQQEPDVGQASTWSARCLLISTTSRSLQPVLAPAANRPMQRTP